MESTEEEGSVILIDESESENSVLLVEDSEEFPLQEENTDEEVIVTFCKRAKVMPHARYDCPTYPFERVECEKSFPLGRNVETCSQCHCYICDKLTAECKNWATPSLCHCNAHNKSKYWKDQWNSALTGGLSAFNLELPEIDADVRCGGMLLQKFMGDVSVEYNKYLSGESISSDFHECLCYQNLAPGQCGECRCHLPCIAHRFSSYTSVSDLVMAFVDQAEKERPKAEVFMLLGAAREIALHKDLTPYSRTSGHLASPNQAVPCLMSRITGRLQRLLVLNDFPKALYDKLTCFYQSIPLPVHCYTFADSLNFLPWDHGLLTSVLKGQNITGKRKHKRKKECIWEIVPVIEARIERMEDCRQYKELVRYLKVVKCSDSKWIQKWRDKLPFYMCKSGDFAGAAYALFTSYPGNGCTARRLSLLQFKVYLKMFCTGQTPSGRDLEDSTQWHPVGAPLKLHFLLKQIFRLLYSNTSLYTDPKSWSSVIMAFASHPALGADGRLIAATLKEPSQEFQEMVLGESCVMEELASNDHANVALKKVFGLGNNLWALKLLLEPLVSHKEVLRSVVSLLLAELCCQKAEMLGQLQHFGPQYVGELLCLFLKSRNRYMPLIGTSIINIIVENLHVCPWAKQVGKFLQKVMKPFGQEAYDVSSSVALLQNSLQAEALED
ncbi:uncharacterized protein LOC133371934 isoform X1 [Rhineura floridana]|uniref:uncharacterized protein LOC133371934 isoform X1 n=1 Tax=Rhineura floridana TaxID=261503 RepID=UPI002AC8617A|nr:uncharacterized protein LOC133371934 isoform X1 [Rhineura floridana]